MKSKTHIYLANLIMEDLERGGLELEGFGKYQIPEEIRKAILGNADYFRAGAIGPDFYPDMIVGQTIIHPENSGEWLEYMFRQVTEISTADERRPGIVAFFAGVMTHYAADLYGHDYVNGWAKGWFPSVDEILSSAEKAKIIIRHILVETYMDQKVPAKECFRIKIPVSFLQECFSDRDCLKRYPKSKSNLLGYMGELSMDVHEKSQDNTIGMLDIFNYYNSWDRDIRNGITEWINTWNKVAADTMSENGLSKAKEDIKYWFSNYFLKMTFLPTALMDIIKKIAEIIDDLNLLKPVKELLLKAVTDIAIQLVYVTTGVKVSDIEEALRELEQIFKNPKLYLNNGILYPEKNITDQLDREFGNYGRSRDTMNQSFEAFYHSLNMAKLCLLGPANLNKLASLSNTAGTPFRNRTCVGSVRKLSVRIETSRDIYSGTDDNVYFAILMKDGRQYEQLFDKSGYNDFEAGDKDTYSMNLPENVQLSQIHAFRLRKDYLHISDDWKPKHIWISDQYTNKLIYEKEINVVIKDRKHYLMETDLKDAKAEIELDPGIISFMYSLDAKGLGEENPTLDKQWAHDGFAFYGDVNLRKKVMTKLFHLSSSRYTSSIFNDYTLAGDKNRITAVKVHAGYIVDSIQLVYDDKYNSPVHGGPGGNEYKMDIIKGDYITQISGSIGSYEYSGEADTIGKLVIKTKNGITFSFGNEKCFVKRENFVCKAPEGYQIFALMGKYIRTDDLDNSYLSRIGIGLLKRM